MAYTVKLKRSAEKELGFLPSFIHDRVIKTLFSLRNQPRPMGVKKLQGREGYRVRVGEYRILYLIDDGAQLIEVYSVAHRKEVYR